MLIEETDSISSLIDEEDDWMDERPDENDFIDYFDKEYEWLSILILDRLLGKINEPGLLSQDSFEIGYDYEPYERKDEQIPYILRDLNTEDDSEAEKEQHPLILAILKEEEQEDTKPEETEDFHQDFEERKAA